MVLRRRIAILALAVALCANGLCRAAERPNILFIMSDDHGYQAISAYGSRVNQTPNIDRIAKEGMRFDRCFVTNSICGPSRAVILTGKYSHLNGFVRNGNRFNGEQQNVAKILRANGYNTAVIGKWHLATTPTGFDYYHILKGQGPYYNPTMITPDGDVKHTGYTTEIITDEALKWLKQRDDSKPFFLLYQHKAPHRNWQPGPDYLDHYDDVEIPEPETLWDDYEGRGSAAKSQAMTIAKHLNSNDLKLTPQRGLTPKQQEAWNAAYGPKNEAFAKAKLEGSDLVKWKYQRYVKDYLRCVDAVDDNVGRVLEYLDESGLADNTMVIYTSDQGWYLGEHGWYDKRWMYEESFRTPLVVRWPGKIKPGSTSNSLCLNLDFPETFLEAAGIAVPDDMQGKSLLPAFAGNVDQWRQSVYYHYYEFPGAHSVQRHYGVRTNRYKLIHFYEINEWEMYDLEKDKNELKSVYDDPDYADIRKALEAELQRLRELYKDDGEVVNQGAARAKNVKLTQAYALASAVLEGEGAIVEKRSGGGFDPAYKPLIVGAWCKPEAGDAVIVAQGGESLGYSLYLKDGVPHFSTRVQGQLRTDKANSQVKLEEWTHLAGRIDADGRMQLLVNGEPTSKRRRQNASGFLTSAPADSFHVGADQGSIVGEYETSLPYRGELKDVRLYWGVLGEEALKMWATQ